MTNFASRIALLVSSALVPATLAAPSKADAIFDRKNRVLQPPPAGLRANNSDLSYRYRSEQARTRVLAADSAITVQPVQSYLNPGDGSGEARLEARQDRREEKLPQYGFSGQRVFGIGFVGAGPYGIFGAEIDFSVGNDWSLGFGIGTGMAYSTWGAQGRYFVNQGKINTFLQFGYANWTLGRVPSSGEHLTPNHLVERFFYGLEPFPKHRTAHLVYPGIGMLYQHPSGLAVTAQIDYLIHMRDFSGGLTGGVGFFYYF